MALGTFRKKRIGCPPGCLLVLFILVVAGGAGLFFVMEPVRDSKKVEQQLLDTLGSVDSYTPAADGTLTPQRIEVFLAVRGKLLAETGAVQQTVLEIDNFERIEDQEEPSASEGLSFFRTVVGFFPQMVEFMNVRNTALLDAEMGLGEYFYIFALAYADQLCPAADGECEFVTSRTTKELTQVLRNQLATLQANSLISGQTTPSLLDALEKEISELEQGDHILPWQNGLPAKIESTLQAYRQQLDQVFSPETRSMELIQKNKNPMGIMD